MGSNSISAVSLHLEMGQLFSRISLKLRKSKNSSCCLKFHDIYSIFFNIFENLFNISLNFNFKKF